MRPHSQPGRVRDAVGLSSPAASVGPRASPIAQDKPAATDTVQLMYDRILNCYYDPSSNRYFELK